MENKSKIVFIITDFGSFENFISELSFVLVHKYYLDITVICSKKKVIDFEDKFIYQNESIKFRFIDIPRGFNIIKQLKASYRINKILNEIKPDLVHAHFTTGIFTTVLLKNVKVEIWGTFHGLGFVVAKGLKKGALHLIENFCFTRLNRIIVLNSYDFENIPSQFLKKTSKQESLGLGCNLDLFDRSNYSGQYINEFKKKYLAENAFILAFTGRFVNFKGFDIVARTFLQLAEKYPGKFKILLIGGRDSIHRTGLSNQEEELFFRHKDVINIGFSSAVNDYLVVADLFFFPSIKEGVPISITEALALGIPAVTFNSRGCNELIKDAHNGYLVSPTKDNAHNVNEFLQRIIYLYENRSVLDTFSSIAILERNKLDRKHFINEHIRWYGSKLNFSSTFS